MAMPTYVIFLLSYVEALLWSNLWIYLRAFVLYKIRMFAKKFSHYNGQNFSTGVTTTSSILVEFLGIISNAVVLSTYFIRICQFLTMGNLFIMTGRKGSPSFVPSCGTPPLTFFPCWQGADTHSLCSVGNEGAYPRKDLGVWSTLKDLSSSSNTRWSMITKPLVKSAKYRRTELFPESVASCVVSIK